MSRNYKFHNLEASYFVSFATVNWIDLFTRQCYFRILSEAINYCRKEKDLELYAYCFMPSHVHFVFRSANADPSGFMRDYKKFTSKKLIKTIQSNPIESRKRWLLKMFMQAAQNKSNVQKYQVWQHHNHPIELWSTKVIKQKIEYIHKNPVKCGFVANPTDWKYSSARNFQDDHTVLEIDEIGFLG